MKDVNDNELVLISFGVVLEVNDKGGDFHKSMMDIEDITYIRHSFHLQYKNKYNESKNKEPIQHSLLWYTFKFIQTCTLFYKSRYTHHTSFLCL
jgi:hypothetical protein